jgi:integrase
MAIEKLNQGDVQTKGVGFHSDGGGLYLSVTEAKAGGSLRKSWVFRYERAGTELRTEYQKARGSRQRDMGLGPTHTVTLDKARALAAAARLQLFENIDPIEQRRIDDAARATAQMAAKPKPTFDKLAADYLKAHERKWSRGHASQWAVSLDTFAKPVLGSKPIDSIVTADIMAMLTPIWFKIPTTATRLRQRVEAILDYAKVLGHRSGDNPAAWRGHLQKALLKKSDIKKIKHHAALAYGEIGAFMQTVRERETFNRLAFEFCVLTAARSGEALGLRWVEIDLDKKTWTCPADRMKRNELHRVPLSTQAIAVLEKAKARADADGFADAEHVFLNARGYRMGSHALADLLKKTLHRRDFTVHGFRSTFRDWAGETTTFPREVCEQALAHSINSATEASYARGDLLEKRAPLMSAWASYCSGPAPEATVLQFPQTAAEA